MLYIAGPMTGRPDKNIQAFHAAEVRLQAKGYQTLNPARHEGNAEDWKGYMRLGLLDVILEADGIAYLPGSGTSHGASLEIHVAQALGLPVQREEDWPVTTHDR